MEMISIERTASDVTIELFDLNVLPGDLATYGGWLDASERDRASRFRLARDRDRFVARRGLLRAALARDLDMAPADLRIEADAQGKPALRDDPDFAFNLSHSNGLMLLATRRGGAIGCDIEWRNPELACLRVAERLFAPQEYAALTALPTDQWVAGFFNCWTRKEAYVKALGLGLSYPLDAFVVSVAPDEPACFNSIEPGWAITSFEPAPGFQAALVAATGPSPAR